MQYLYDTDSLYVISGFCGILWKPFYIFLKKEPKNLRR